MKIQPFKLERYFAQHEFKVQYLLSSSDPESLTMAQLLAMASPESRALWEDLRLGYTESQGHPLLRKEAAALYSHIHEDNILVAAPEELIFIAMQTMLSPGEHVVTVSPAYQSLYEIANAAGCRVTPWQIKPDENGWSFDLDELEQVLTDQTRMLVLNFPHNPTGHVLSQDDFEAVIALARRHDLILFSDEMYRQLAYDPAQRLPAVCDVYEKGISLSGLSKAFGLPGLRTGWLAAQDPAWMERWQAFKDYTTICNSAPGEILGIIALQNKDAILQRTLNIIRSNLATADHFFDSHADLFCWRRPMAGSVAFPEWLGKGTVEAFCQDVLDRSGVMLVPGSLFDYPGNFFRLGLGRSNFEEALGKLDEYLTRKKYK